MRTEEGRACECNGCVRKAGYHIPDPVNTTVGYQHKQAQMRVYTTLFDRTQLPYDYNDKYRCNENYQYQIPPNWLSQMQEAVRAGFDYTMLEKTLRFHRAHIHELTGGIALQLAKDQAHSAWADPPPPGVSRCKQLQGVAMLLAATSADPSESLCAWYFDFDAFQTMCKNRDAHRDAALMLQRNAVMLQKNAPTQTR